MTLAPAAAGPNPGVPAVAARKMDDLRLRTADGVLLAARRWCSAAPEASVVLAHGFSGSQDEADMHAMTVDLCEAGFDVLTYDARGHGRSEGLCGVGSTEHLDVACAAAAAAERGLPVVLVGVSMGGIAVASHLAVSQGVPPVAGAVLVSTPARWQMRLSPVGILTACLTRTRPGRWLASRRLRVRIARGWQLGDPLESLVARIEEPLAIVHGTEDRLLAGDHARRLHASAAGPSHLHLVEGMGHGVDAVGRVAATSAVRWVLSALPPAPTTTRGR